MRKFTATLFLLATLTMAVTAAPAMAEEDLGQVNYQGGYGPYSYHLFQYPSNTSNFFFYPESYVEFEIQNGKYWMLDASRFNMSDVSTHGPADAIIGFGMENGGFDHLDISFYSPDGKLIGGYDALMVNSPFSIPHDGNDYEKIKVRIECHSKQNIDARLMVWDPVDVVVAKPIGDKKK